jgi:PAS domain S-box-containing protein
MHAPNQAMAASFVESAEFLGFAEALPVICWLSEPDGRVRWVNRRWVELTGEETHDVESHRPLTDAVREHAAKGVAFSLTADLHHAEGGLKSFLLSARPVRRDDGSVACWIGTGTEAGDGLDRSQAFLLRLGDAIREESDPEAILSTVSDQIGRELHADRIVYATVDWNSGMMRVGRDWRADGPRLGAHDYPLADFPEDYLKAHSRGEPLISFDIANDADVSPAMRARFLAVGVHAFASVPLVKRGELRAIMSAQQFAPRRWTAAELRLLDEVAARTWATLERAQADAALRESEQLFRTVTEAHPIPVVIAQDGGVVLGNPAFYEMMGLPQGDHSTFDPKSWTVGGLGWEKFATVVRSHERYDNYETKLVRGGGRFPVAVSWRHIVYKGAPAVISSIVDLSDRKRAEEELARSRDALHQAEKLTALGSLLAGVSHELNNPLSIVTAQSALLEEMTEGTDVAVRAEKVRRAAERCSKIVQTFLAMARQKPPERRTVDAAEIVSAALDLTEYSLRTTGIEVTRDIAAGLPPLHADPDQLHQVLVNLIVNAQQALQEQAGPRSLAVRVGPADEPAKLRIEIEDNGPGVPPEIRRRVFEPFFTTKPQGTGTGVGLSFSLGLVEAHGGTLELLEGAEGGACFRVTLDTVDRAPEPAVEAVILPAATAQRGTVLVVDDEADVAEVLGLFAERAGYRVDIAENGATARAMLAERDYDIILSDLRMPQFDGPALFDWLTAEKAHLVSRIGFVTGDTLGEAAARFVARCGRPVIEKPFTGESVRRLLAELAPQHPRAPVPRIPAA